MRTVFRPWDVEAGSKGYVTEDDFKKRVRKTVELFPELGASLDKLYNQAHRHWIDHCNCGVEMPEGYRLTEAQYIQNMWLNIHQPSFEKHLREASKIFWERVDKDNKGYLTTEEAKKIGFKLTKDGEKRGIFEALDKEENTGQITFEDSIKTQNFFFTDQENEDHPFTFVRGPLVED